MMVWNVKELVVRIVGGAKTINAYGGEKKGFISSLILKVLKGVVFVVWKIKSTIHCTAKSISILIMWAFGREWLKFC